MSRPGVALNDGGQPVALVGSLGHLASAYPGKRRLVGVRLPVSFPAFCCHTVNGNDLTIVNLSERRTYNDRQCFANASHRPTRGDTSHDHRHVPESLPPEL